MAGDVERNSAHITDVTEEVESLTGNMTTLTEDFVALAEGYPRFQGIT